MKQSKLLPQINAQVPIRQTMKSKDNMMLRKSQDKPISPTVNDNQNNSVFLKGTIEESQNFFKEFDPRLEVNNVLPNNSHRRNRSNVMLPPELQTYDNNFSTLSSIGNGLINKRQESRNNLENSRLSQLSKTNPIGFENKHTRAGSCIQPTNIDLFPRTIQNVSVNTQFFKGHNYQLKAIPNVKFIDPNRIEKTDKIIKLKKEQVQYNSVYPPNKIMKIYGNPLK